MVTEIEQRKNELFDYVMMVCKMGIMPDIKKLNILINKFQQRTIGVGYYL